ncbi:hypothetical protein Bhyg_12528 [Pseudolycoriella hygida]|uniref:MADF domain-containing protein n=1 Tax=Pseudolycoriella hygida TaxID=35572 RepID=A0A9Q0S0Y5_9DIPT|nr:hypothetical protein Bhyg_12528 [Pseudolycoriella hygida]
MGDKTMKPAKRVSTKKRCVVVALDPEVVNVDTEGFSKVEESASTSTSQKKPTVPTRKNFTEYEEDAIIEFYSKNRFLWDHNDVNYKIAVKSASLQELVQQLGNKFTAQEIHHRFSGMRTTYKNNVAKVKKSTSTGASADDIYVPTWPHFENMKFLEDSTPNRTSICSYTVGDAIEVEALDLSDATDVFDLMATQSKEDIKENQRFQKPKMLSKAKSKQVEVVDECLQVLRSIDMGKNDTANATLKDRCDSYGEFVAASLKVMSLWNQSLAMADISNVLLNFDPNNPHTGNPNQ